MKNTISKLFALAIIGGLAACSEDDSSEQPALRLNFNSVTSSFDLQAKTSFLNPGTFVFDEGTIRLSEIEYEAETDNDSTSVDFELEGNVVIDFATGIPTPDIRAITIPEGTYEDVSIEVELADETGNPAIVLNGLYTSPDSMEHPIRFEFNSDEEFEVEREGTIVFAENQSAIAEITFDPSVWFAGVTDQDMANASKNTNGVIVISEDQNTAIFDSVEEGLELAMELEIDN